LESEAGSQPHNQSEEAPEGIWYDDGARFDDELEPGIRPEPESGTEDAPRGPFGVTREDLKASKIWPASPPIPEIRTQVDIDAQGQRTRQTLSGNV
jgi:hypothetical protein